MLLLALHRRRRRRRFLVGPIVLVAVSVVVDFVNVGPAAAVCASLRSLVHMCDAAVHRYTSMSSDMHVLRQRPQPLTQSVALRTHSVGGCPGDGGVAMTKRQCVASRWVVTCCDERGRKAMAVRCQRRMQHIHRMNRVSGLERFQPVGSLSLALQWASRRSYNCVFSWIQLACKEDNRVGKWKLEVTCTDYRKGGRRARRSGFCNFLWA